NAGPISWPNSRASFRRSHAGLGSPLTRASLRTIPCAPARRSTSPKCLPCHKLNGGGASDVGPDLNLPMNPTEYMTGVGLHALIPDPKSVHTWPGQRMNGLPPDLLSDREIGIIVDYLKRMAGQ